MSSAPYHLTVLFEDAAEAARTVCRRHFIDLFGIIRPKLSKKDIPQPLFEEEAIDYLILEWDYSYEET